MHAYILYACMYVYLCTCVCMYVRMYACTYVCTYVRMYACMYVCMYACTYVYMYACMYVCRYVCMYVCVCMYACIYVQCTSVCMYVSCMYICMYVGINSYIFFTCMVSVLNHLSSSHSLSYKTINMSDCGEYGVPNSSVCSSLIWKFQNSTSLAPEAYVGSVCTSYLLSWQNCVVGPTDSGIIVINATVDQAENEQLAIETLEAIG